MPGLWQGRLHHQSHRTAYARFRLNTGADQLVDHGHAFGVAGRAYGAPLRERAQGGAVAERRPAHQLGELPGLEEDKYHALAEKYMPNGTCGVISFGVPGGREKVSAFLDHLKMVSIATHVADARSCTLYPAGTTHRQLTEEQLVEAGVGIDLVRLSCGIENADDIITDLDQALAAVQ